MIEAGDFDVASLDAAEDAIADDEQLGDAIDGAVEELVERLPWLTRALARRVVVALIFLSSLAALWAITLVQPVAAVGLSAAGLSARDAARLGGDLFDEIVPPREGEEDSPA